VILVFKKIHGIRLHEMSVNVPTSFIAGEVSSSITLKRLDFKSYLLHSENFKTLAEQSATLLEK
jgi:hypothetical protein